MPREQTRARMAITVSSQIECHSACTNSTTSLLGSLTQYYALDQLSRTGDYKFDPEMEI